MGGGGGEGGRSRRALTIGGGNEEEVRWEWRLVGEDWVQVFCEGEEKGEEAEKDS